jgi:hypothetical protein
VFNVEGSGDKAIPAQSIFPVIGAQDRLKVAQRDKRIKSIFVFHGSRVDPPIPLTNTRIPPNRENIFKRNK